FAREPEILRFLSGYFGPYPFRAAGGIVDADGEWDYALENESRPIYTPQDFRTQAGGDSVVVHELTHQWYGDSVSVEHWQDIWLNEGFATYAEWLWSDVSGGASVDAMAAQWYRRLSSLPATIRLADPGVRYMFDERVYKRGGVMLHALRRRLGDVAFFRLLRDWAGANRHSTVTTEAFLETAERFADESLGEFFTQWLFDAALPRLRGQ
ncbi:MAG TPA: M1 family aminopeptidase, partial [Micromonosporaceae bacterium]